MKKKLYLSSFLFFFTCVSNNIDAQSYSEKERLFELSMIWKDGATKFHNPELLQTINWDSLYISNIPLVQKAQSDYEYYSILSQFIAMLQDGHSNIGNEGYYKRNDFFDFLPIEISSISHKYYITTIQKNRTEEIPLGSEVLKINNINTSDYIKKYAMPFVSASTKQDRLRKALEYMQKGKSNDSLLFQIKTDKNKVKNVYLKYNFKTDNIKRTDIVGTYFSSINYYRSTNTFLTKDSKNRDYYHLRLDHFTNGNITKLIKSQADSLKKADYIVLDLRYNGGGNELEADTLLMSFLNIDTLKTYKSVTRKDNAFYAAMGYGYKEYNDYYKGLAMDTLPENIFEKKDLPLFTQPLFVLIGTKTYSAAEDFLITLKLHYPERAIFVGMPTGGSSGAPFVRRLAYHNAYYRICTRRAALPNDFFEYGIQPDHFYESNLKDHLGTKDCIFEFVEQLYDKRENRK